jgi:hypothetical protein
MVGLLAAFRQLRGDLDGGHHPKWSSFVVAANPGLTAEDQSERLRDLELCQILAIKQDQFVFFNSDVEFLFAIYGWLSYPTRMKANPKQAGELLNWIKAWQFGEQTATQLIDVLPLPTSAQNFDIHQAQPVIEFILNTSEINGAGLCAPSMDERIQARQQPRCDDE